MNGVKNMLASFEAENINNEFLNVQMEQLHSADTRDNCLATLERMDVSTEEYEPELAEEEAAMADLLDEMGMTMESIEFTEECGKKCGGGTESTTEEDEVDEAFRKKSKKSKKKKEAIKECGPEMEYMLARIPEGSVAETTNFFKATREGLTKENASMVNESLSLLDSILGETPVNESFYNDPVFDDIGMESFDFLMADI